jgi:hypothetical protein
MDRVGARRSETLNSDVGVVNDTDKSTRDVVRSVISALYVIEELRRECRGCCCSNAHEERLRIRYSDPRDQSVAPDSISSRIT